MNHKKSILVLTFAESIASILLVRGIYFFTHERLAFSERENLWLALGYGILYIAGAYVSHGLSVRIGERRATIWLISLLAGVHLLLTAAPNSVAIAALFPLTALLQGLKWPIIESFVSAGVTPKMLIRLIGRYNVAWAFSVPLGLAGSGPLIASRFPEALFGSAALLNFVALAFTLRLPARPTHLHESHPERPVSGELSRYGGLVLSARWTMMTSYMLLFLLAPLMPEVFGRLGLSVAQATPAAAILDLARLICFATLGVLVAWHSRAQPLVITTLVLPASFCMILLGKSLFVVLVGEILFGIAAGFAYYAALYYALVVKNASVDAGGAHEALIGTGFALGPLVGLIAKYLSLEVTGISLDTAVLLVALPFVLVATAGALLPLTRLSSRLRA